MNSENNAHIKVYFSVTQMNLKCVMHMNCKKIQSLTQLQWAFLLGFETFQHRQPLQLQTKMNDKSATALANISEIWDTTEEILTHSYWVL